MNALHCLCLQTPHRTHRHRRAPTWQKAVRKKNRALAFAEQQQQAELSDKGDILQTIDSIDEESSVAAVSLALTAAAAAAAAGVFVCACMCTCERLCVGTACAAAVPGHPCVQLSPHQCGLLPLCLSCKPMHSLPQNDLQPVPWSTEWTPELSYAEEPAPLNWEPLPTRRHAAGAASNSPSALHSNRGFQHLFTRTKARSNVPRPTQLQDARQVPMHVHICPCICGGYITAWKDGAHARQCRHPQCLAHCLLASACTCAHVRGCMSL